MARPGLFFDRGGSNDRHRPNLEILAEDVIPHLISADLGYLTSFHSEGACGHPDFNGSFRHVLYQHSAAICHAISRLLRSCCKYTARYDTPFFRFLRAASSFVESMPLNVEIKAHCRDPEGTREVLSASGARREGLDHQIDTYFVVPNGRLKLRQGNIETNLIHYSRPDESGPKASVVDLYAPSDAERLRALLGKALGIWVVVDKRREIWYYENVKLHVDEVADLGHFVEIEVIARPDLGEAFDESEMQKTCGDWMVRLGIRSEDLVSRSYSDLMHEAT